MSEQVKPAPRAYQANVFWDRRDCATLSAQVYLASDADSYIDALRTQVVELRAENMETLEEWGTQRLQLAKARSLLSRVVRDVSQLYGYPGLLSEIEAVLAYQDEPTPEVQCKACSDTPQQGPDVRGLAAFALELIDGAWKGGSFDGGDIQEAGVRHGLLAVEQREESCGEHCDCAEYGFPSECYRLTPSLAAHRQAQQGGSHDT